MGKVVIVATLDTKGPEVAHLRDRLLALGVESLVVDSGILGEPVGIVPDVSHAELAGRGGITLAQLQASGTRGRAVEIMRGLVQDLVRERFDAGELELALCGVASLAAVGELELCGVDTEDEPVEELGRLLPALSRLRLRACSLRSFPLCLPVALSRALRSMACGPRC